MNFLPVDAIVLFVGGPNNGFIEVGDNAMYFAVNLELPKEAETKPGDVVPIAGERAQVGRRIMLMPKYAQDAGRAIGMRKAVELWGKYGPEPLPSPVYELSQVDLNGSDGDVFVYKYIGDHSEVFPEKK